MSEFRVEKREVAARLFLTQGEILDGTLYLAAFSPRHSGPQTARDLMTEARPFLPFRRNNGSFVLIGKAAVAAIRVANAAPDSGIFLRVPVRLQLVGGHGLEGELFAEKGTGERLSDLLDGPDEWLMTEVDEHLHWVCRQHVHAVEAAA